MTRIRLEGEFRRFIEAPCVECVLDVHGWQDVWGPVLFVTVLSNHEYEWRDSWRGACHSPGRRCGVARFPRHLGCECDVTGLLSGRGPGFEPGTSRSRIGRKAVRRVPLMF